MVAFKQALRLEPNLPQTHVNFGKLAAELGQWDLAAVAFRLAVTDSPDSAEAWSNLGSACDHLNVFDEAEVAFRKATALDPSDMNFPVQLAASMERAGRDIEAAQIYADVARRQGIVVIPCLGDVPQARILIVGARGSSNVPVTHLFDSQRFETVSLHLPRSGLDKGEVERIFAEMPKCDIAFNAIGEAAAEDPVLASVAAALERFGGPVLNRPECVPLTGRDLLPALLAGIPGLIIPPTQRLTRDELMRLSEQAAPFAGAMLVRPTGTHGGRDLCKVDQPSDLKEILTNTRSKAYFLSQFVDYRSTDGLYRKYRFLFVDGKPYSYHLAIHSHWLIHYFRTEMGVEVSRKAEEEAFMDDFSVVFPGQAVCEVARRIGLDYGGMDCGITQDGQVVVFESNACMLLHLHDSAEEFPYKHRHVPTIIDAISQMIGRRVEGAKG